MISLIAEEAVRYYTYTNCNTVPEASVSRGPPEVMFFHKMMSKVSTTAKSAVTHMTTIY